MIPNNERYAAFRPPAISAAYGRYVAALMRRWTAIVKEKLTPELFERELRKDAFPEQIRLRLGQLEIRFAELFEQDDALLKRAYTTGLSVENLADKQWRRLIGVGAVPPDPLRVAKFAERNVQKITSVAAQNLNEVKELIETAIIEGTRPERLTKQIDKRFGIGIRKAKRIAVDQTLKYHSNVVQEKQTGAGVTRYIWTTSNDERVRDTHADLEGKEFYWNDPPISNDQGDTNHPGEDYNCRCIAYPVIDWLSAEDWGLSALRSNVNVPRA
jgi:SPP1 gp7 family putative phage head morphogenesis protein